MEGTEAGVKRGYRARTELLLESINRLRMDSGMTPHVLSLLSLQCRWGPSESDDTADGSQPALLVALGLCSGCHLGELLGLLLHLHCLQRLVVQGGLARLHLRELSRRSRLHQCICYRLLQLRVAAILGSDSLDELLRGWRGLLLVHG